MTDIIIHERPRPGGGTVHVVDVARELSGAEHGLAPDELEKMGLT